MRIPEAKVVILGAQGVGKTSFIHRYVGQMFEQHTSPTIGASFFTCNITVDEHQLKLLIWDTAGQERFRCMAPMYYRKANAAILMFDITCFESFESMKSWVIEIAELIELIAQLPELISNANNFLTLIFEIWKAILNSTQLASMHYIYLGILTNLLFDLLKQVESFSPIQELKMRLEEPIILCVVGNKCDMNNFRQVGYNEAMDYAFSIGALYHEASALSSEGVEGVFLDIAQQIIRQSEASLQEGIHSFNEGRIIRVSSLKQNENADDDDDEERSLLCC